MNVSRFHSAMAAAVLITMAVAGQNVDSRPGASRADPAPTTRPTTDGVVDPSFVHADLEAAFHREGWVGLGWALLAPNGTTSVNHLGFEDRERGVKAGPTTRWRWASISKPVTAIAALQLVEQGKLDLDRDVRAWVPEFPEKPWPVTARQLGGHLGGIVHYTNGEVIALPRPDAPPDAWSDVVRALDAFKMSPLVAEPGTRYAYTTHGYMLLGAVVQRAGGAPYVDQVRDRIVRPLGMTSFEPDYGWKRLPNRAKGYKKKGAVWVESGDTDVSWKLPGGGYLSNVADLARFGRGVMDGRLLSPASRTLMATRGATRDGKATTYGFGWGLYTIGGRAVLAHSGSQEKTSTYLAVVPDAGLGLAVMCNCEGAKIEPLVKDFLEKALPRGR